VWPRNTTFFRHVVDVDDGDGLDLRFKLGQLALDGAVLFLGEMIFRVLRQIPQRGRKSRPGRRAALKSSSDAIDFHERLSEAALTNLSENAE